MSSRKSARPSSSRSKTVKGKASSRSGSGKTSSRSKPAARPPRDGVGMAASLSSAMTARSRPTPDPNVSPQDHLIALIKRIGGRSTKGIYRIYKGWTKFSNGLMFDDLKQKLHEHHLYMNDKDIRRVLRLWDRDGNDTLNFDDFLIGIKGKLNTARREKVGEAFNILDEDRSGTIEFAEIKSKYNAKSHPDVKLGKKTEDQVLAEFVKVYEGDRSNGDNQITKDEFEEYYRGLSANIESDRMFIGMMNRSWDTKKMPKGVRVGESARGSARPSKPDLAKKRSSTTKSKSKTSSRDRDRDRDSSRSRRPSSSRSRDVRDSRRK